MPLLDVFKKKKKPDYLDLESTGIVPGAYGPAGYPETAGLGGMGGMPPMQGSSDIPGLPPMEFPQQGPMMPQPQPAPLGTEHLENIRSQLDALNYKLDTLRAVLDSLNSRLANIETALKASPMEKGEGWNY